MSGARERRLGRRPGEPDTRGVILKAARHSFAHQGFDRSTMRAIARAAGVDAALVHHYFGTKEQLFVAAMEFPVDPASIVPGLLAAGPEGLGDRIARTFVSVWDAPGTVSPMIALIRGAVSHERSAAMLREFVTHAFLGRITAALDVDEPATRASLVGSALIGLAMARYVLKLEPLASLSADETALALGPTLQRYLTGPLP